MGANLGAWHWRPCTGKPRCGAAACRPAQPRANRPSHPPSRRRVFTCARNQADLDALLQQCHEAGWDVRGIQADVSQAEDRQRLMQAVSDAFGGSLNVLFNNVGKCRRCRCCCCKGGGVLGRLLWQPSCIQAITRGCVAVLHGTAGVVSRGSPLLLHWLAWYGAGTNIRKATVDFTQVQGG